MECNIECLFVAITIILKKLDYFNVCHKDFKSLIHTFCKTLKMNLRTLLINRNQQKLLFQIYFHNTNVLLRQDLIRIKKYFALPNIFWLQKINTFFLNDI